MVGTTTRIARSAVQARRRKRQPFSETASGVATVYLERARAVDVALQLREAVRRRHEATLEEEAQAERGARDA